MRQISIPPTTRSGRGAPGPERIGFELDRLGAAAPGLLEVSGRWYGVRGRRFVRPALILAAEPGRSRRVLAELDDKPWVAEDGSPWRAAFRLDGQLPAGPLQLSVAPDITVTLRSGDTAGDGADNGDSPTRAFAAVAAVPPARAGRAAVPPARAADAERLGSRLAAAESERDRERERRREAEAALEEQRAQARRTTAELGRLRAELELARAAELPARDTAAQLDAARRDHHITQERYQALAAEHESVLRDHAATRAELEARTGALRSARDALEAERTQRSEREDRAARTAPPAPEPPTRSSGATAADGDQGHPHSAAHIPPPPRSDRPLNPSLRSNSWLLRLLAVLVLAAALLAIYLVLHSTVLS